MRHAHVCPHCDHRSTRWWNLKVHIKRRHGGFLLGRSSDMDSNSLSPNNPYHNIGSTTVADSVGDTFRLRGGAQQAHQGTSQYSPSTIFRPPRMDHQSYGTGLSQETIAKLEELKRLVYKYPQFHNIDPDKIVRWAVHGAISGDNTFLDEKLKQLVSLDFYNV
jgi:hypothetical protein